MIEAKKATLGAEKGLVLLVNYPISCNFAVNEKNVHLVHWYNIAHRGGMLCTNEVDARDVTDGALARLHALRL